MTENVEITSFTLSASGTGTVTYEEDGYLPSGLTLDANSGEISGTPNLAGAAQSVTFTATDDMGTPAYYIDDETSTTTASFPIVNAAAGTVAFQATTTLTSKIQSESINETVVATATPNSAITYTFISSTDDAEGIGITGTPITINGNQISGVAPRLYVAATYSFTFKATTAGGAINTQTFTIFISQDATCVSPSNNICT